MTITMCGVLPEIVEPFCEIELETRTAMYGGSGPAGGGVLLPGSVVQFVPQLETGGVSSKPLKAAGAAPPLRRFSFDHCAPQNVTEVPTALFPSPITNPPPPGAKAAISTVHEVVVMLPPSSTTVVVIVKKPVEV